MGAIARFLGWLVGYLQLLCTGIVAGVLIGVLIRWWQHRPPSLRQPTASRLDPAAAAVWQVLDEARRITRDAAGGESGATG